MDRWVAASALAAVLMVVLGVLGIARGGLRHESQRSPTARWFMAGSIFMAVLLTLGWVAGFFVAP